MMNLMDMKLSHRFMALFAILIVGFATYGAWSFKVLNNFKVNGPVYQRIVQGKDLIGDILPPPEYIIESYLVSLQVIAAPAAERKPLIENLKSLKKDYDTRHDFWAKENLDGALKDQLLTASDKPAQEFYQIAFNQFVPALEKDDNAAAAAALETMKQRYAVHREAINKLVEMANKRNETDEANAKTEIQTATWVMMAILIGTTGLVSLFLLVISHSLIKQLGGEPNYAADIAGKIAAGDLAVSIDTKPNDQTSLLVAMKTMRDSLAKTASEVRTVSGQIAERTTQLEAANKELEAFTYSVSHDLRAPLRHIDGYVDLLVSRCRDGLSDKGLHYVDTIASSAREMGILIDELLQFSRTGRAELRRESVDMSRALQEALIPIKEGSAGRSIEWIIGELPSVRGDFVLLRQVWANLLGNAVKFTRQRDVARIEVSAREGNGEITFLVADNGVGFDMQYANKLFGVFQRLHSQEEFEGTGIGLANVQRIIARHGGRVWAEAVVDQGATFYFTLPNNKEANHG